MVTQQTIPFAGVPWALLYQCSLPGLWGFPLFLVGANRSRGFGGTLFSHSAFGNLLWSFSDPLPLQVYPSTGEFYHY